MKRVLLPEEAWRAICAKLDPETARLILDQVERRVNVRRIRGGGAVMSRAGGNVDNLREVLEPRPENSGKLDPVLKLAGEKPMTRRRNRGLTLGEVLLTILIVLGLLWLRNYL